MESPDLSKKRSREHMENDKIDDIHIFISKTQVKFEVSGQFFKIDEALTSAMEGDDAVVHVLDESTRRHLYELSIKDFLFRKLCESVKEKEAEGNCKIIKISPGVLEPWVMERSCISMVTTGKQSPQCSILRVTLALLPSIGISNHEFQDFIEAFVKRVILTWKDKSNLKSEKAITGMRSLVDQHSLRYHVKKCNGIAFIANGSILPQMQSPSGVGGGVIIPFLSPPTLEAEFVLPFKGTIKGMLLKEGVNVVTGGGYHGKSTLLRSLIFGVYDKLPGDIKEFVVAVENSVTIRAEDGRFVSCVDCSPFINDLPAAADIDPTKLSTVSASGSTSMAASVMESLYDMKAKVLLLDEDTCASNFMLRDSRMRALISHEPITPFIYRVNGISKQLGISTVVVIGGSGDWLDVQDTTIMMDNYKCLDGTKRALSISKTFCTGRVQYNGRGLVHQLPWPFPDDDDGDKATYRRRCVNLGRMYERVWEIGNKMQNNELLTSPLIISCSDCGNLMHLCDELILDLNKVEQRTEKQATLFGFSIMLCWTLLQQHNQKSTSMLQPSSPSTSSCSLPTPTIPTTSTNSSTITTLENLYSTFIETAKNERMDEILEKINGSSFLRINYVNSSYFVQPRYTEFVACMNRLRVGEFVYV